MMETILLEVATPDRLLVSEPVREVQIPTSHGYIGVLPEHAPLLAELGIGVLSYVTGNETKRIAVSGGYVEVRPERVRVLADVAEPSGEIDVERALAALKRAEERLRHPEPGIDIARAINAMRRAQARLAAAGRPVEK